MKKSAVLITVMFSLLMLIGCGLDHSTNLGTDVMKDINPSLLEQSKNIKPFALDTSIVKQGYSVPDGGDVSFGAHTGTALPVGGMNGEVSTGYLSFRTSYAALKDFNQYDSIYAVSIYLDTANSAKADYNRDQDIRIISLNDSTMQYNRFFTKVDSVRMLSSVADSVSKVNNDCDVSNNSLIQRVYKSSVSGVYNKDGKKIDSLFVPDTFNFLLVSQSDNSKFAYFGSSPIMKIYTKYGTVDSAKTVKDTIGYDTVSERTTRVYRSKKSDTASYSDLKITDTLTLDTLRSADTVLLAKWSTKSIASDTLRIEDSSRYSVLDSVYRKQIRTFVSDTVIDSTRIITTTTDTISVHKRNLHYAIRLRKLTSRVYTLSASYTNYAVCEIPDSIAAHKDSVMSSFGPQRTAVFKINVDSLWKELQHGADINGKRFSEILSAGMTISGKINYAYTDNLSYTRAAKDSTIAFRWLISDKAFTDGISLHSKMESWAIVDTLKSGNTIVIPVEKYLQELSSAKNPEVYLYLELRNNADYWKEVIWSKPSLSTVLTTLD